MPSVRVKRASGYSYLQDVAQDAADTPGPSRRARRGSIAALFTPRPDQDPNSGIDFPMQSSSLTANGSPSRQRERASSSATSGRASGTGTGSEGGASLLEQGRPRHRRTSSRVTNHIMSSTRTSTAPLRHISENRDPFAAAAEVENRTGKSRRHHGSFSLSRHHENEEDDMISLEGQQTDVLVPKTEHEPGRVGSSLSLPRSQRSDYTDYDHGFDGDHHPDDIVEHLDVIDPQISTVATLTNAANGLVIPPLEWYSRKPVVVLPRTRRRKNAATNNGSAAEKGEAGEGGPEEHDGDEDNLDLHVEDVLRKRDRARRVMQGVWSFVKTPLGVITAIYGLLVVFWGTALVFFLARFINVHNDNTQDFWVEVCQQIETGLFSLTSIGLMPFRTVDTYRVFKIWWYKRKTEKLRRAAGLPELYDPNDLPDPQYDVNFVPVLTDTEQIDLHYQQHMFMQSQTWYRPHGTQTHRAFPIDTAVWITVMNDLNSIFQCLLSGCMWGLNRFDRPAWTTATTLPAAFVAGIVAGVLIWWGSKKTKRVQEVTDRLMMVLALEPSAASAASDRGAVVLREKVEQAEKAQSPRRPEMSDTEVVGDGSRVPTARTTSRPDSEPQCKDYADTMVGSVENSPTIEAPVMRAGDSQATPSMAIADEMTVPPADQLDEKR